MRIVVKVGTSTLAHATGRLNIQRMERLCKVLSDLKNAGHEIILVSSGAIGMGVGKLSLSARPKDMPTKQAAAAIGQCELMYIYDKLFSEYNHIVAQLLITAPDLAEGGSRKAHFHNTLARLLELGALPVINENDTVSTDEIVIGDNDTLSAIVSATVSANLLILLSDIDGLYDRDPRRDPDAKLIETVPVIDARILSLAGDKGSELATGGMVTKLHAAQGLTPVELRLDAAAAQIIDGTPAGEQDFDTEYLDYILAVGVVDSLDAAIAHVLAHSTHHSDAIVTEDAASAERFINGTDSAATYVNVSTRFTDGGEFGLGCEMGISTQKLHARGPMGLDELSTYKYIIRGDGQIR